MSTVEAGVGSTVGAHGWFCRSLDLCDSPCAEMPLVLSVEKRVPVTFQLAAFVPVRAFCECFSFNKLCVFNAGEYSESVSLRQNELQPQVAYVGNKGTHLWISNESGNPSMNQLPPQDMSHGPAFRKRR